MPKCLLFAGEILSGGFNFVQISFRIPGEMIYFDKDIVVRWVVQPPTRIGDRKEISTCLIGGKHQLRLEDKEGEKPTFVFKRILQYIVRIYAIIFVRI